MTSCFSHVKRIICELIILTANWLSAKWFTILCE
nr:MAG TPA: hypothetical protein [Caudoviricetes sp.]